MGQGSASGYGERLSRSDGSSEPGSVESDRAGRSAKTAETKSSGQDGKAGWWLAWHYAGILGIHPGEWTLRELMAAAEARSRHHWDIAASILALIANVNRDPKRRHTPFSPAEFNPHVARHRPDDVDFRVKGV